MNFSSHTKEIKTDKEKTFIGKAEIGMNISQIGWFQGFESPIEKKILTIEEFQTYVDETEQLISDPSYQSVIIEGIIDGIENFWKYKILGGTWIETKAIALAKAKEHVDLAFNNLIIDIDSHYNIETLPGYFMDTPREPIGRIIGEHVKTCKSYPALLDTTTQSVTDRIEADMKENIDNDNAKIENDLMMLQMLLRKYPEYNGVKFATIN